ncbi:dihydropteroate synthase [Candidatus Aquiluna sp. UB-MaderosW2red]|uniref:dihydropteroate synthase n=1 Tax=Candidatus Aquiluna sp. UB-MaderosW2red TaxID=1855377 RepID=UPI000875EA14|nr:dihydropteroate synthase [Candidatus Aquiluna sp. UB-MaderosW2red]SCX02771.1 dihydropteroate synthase [Candidatus Aquiluna sp. UB-MaderosW2red]
MKTFARPLVMGVINITPDSFSDGGEFLDADYALAQARLLMSQGAQILDIGGESTRPGAIRISPDIEQQRILPVLRLFKEKLNILISVDTMNSETAKLAIAAGADFINDVSGGLADPEMFRAVAKSDARYVLSHWRGNSSVMDQMGQYQNIAKEVVSELAEQVAIAVAAGISRERIIVDPGLGFAKDIKQNWELVSRLDELEALDLPILVGASRKRFLANALDETDPAAVSNPRRDVATAVLTALLLQRKLWGVRVHNVETTMDAIKVVEALRNSEVQK